MLFRSKRKWGVKRRLTAQSVQHCIRALLFDDFGDDFRRNRLHISGVGQIGVGHDRRRIGIDQDNPIALFLQRLACLRARIVELACLTDNNRTRSEEHTSELQSLMRISYAVFCLKKKINKHTTNITQSTLTRPDYQQPQTIVKDKLFSTLS